MRVNVDDPRANHDCVWMRVNAQIRRHDPGRRKRVNCESGGLFGLGAPLVPPILFVETAHCYHLMFDFFRNAWMVKPQQYEVPIPRISDINSGQAEESGKTPWLTAAKRANVQRGKKADRGRGGAKQARA